MKIPETLLIETLNKPAALVEVLQVAEKHDLYIDSMRTVSMNQDRITWEVTLDYDADAHATFIQEIKALDQVKLKGSSDRVFTRHEGGKIEIRSKAPIASITELREIYTPGVARVCLAIQKDLGLAMKYTNLANTIAIVTNGTAILGLGHIGAVAGLPVMEGKSALFKHFANISCVPILIENQDQQTIIDTVVNIAPSFAAIQLEDIAAPDCFDIEAKLRERLDKPVLHDDQHGTAVVTLGALLSATRSIKMDLKGARVGVIGLGAAGLGISRLLLGYGVKELFGSDLTQEEIKRLEKIGGKGAGLPELMEKSNVVVATTGVKGLIKPEMVQKGQVILALTNPDPEIEPSDALQAGAAFAADGKSVNNVLAFPGLFRGVLDARVKAFKDEMLFAAAEALAASSEEGEILPQVLDQTVHDKVSQAVFAAATKG